MFFVAAAARSAQMFSCRASDWPGQRTENGTFHRAMTRRRFQAGSPGAADPEPRPEEQSQRMGFGFNVGFGTTSNSRTMPPVVRRADTTAFVSTPRGPLQSQHLIDQNSGSGASTPRSARDSHVAETYGECAVCFDPLCAQRTAVLTQEHGRGMRKERTRSCAHFFHLACANELRVHHAKCPICRAPFNGVLPVPSPGEDPDGWFAAVDVDGDGRLSPSEVLEALRAQIRCDWHAIERQLPKLWRRWDINGDGYVEKNELVSRGGLIEYVTKHFPKREHRERPPPPSIARAPNELFEYWDEDGSGELEKEEVVRALVKTFGLGADMPSLRNIRQIVDAVWCVFDPDGSGAVDRREFLMRDGLADTIVASCGAWRT